ncbi:PEP-CTERM sorting domain-containing protein [Kiritimatiellota bacterium B12222]|nr:PEP-CTERM sorting domain-containing protein [Kiritimatiellota bacterium B12222]
MSSSKNYLKTTFSALCLVGAGLICSSAQAGWTIWTNASGDGLWETAGNWSGGLPNYASQAPIINNLTTTGPSTANTGTYSYDYLRVGHAHDGHEGPGTLNINGANLSSKDGGNTREGIGYGNGGVGILNISSGSLTLGQQWVSIGGGGGSQGTVNQTGGLMSFGGDNPNSISLGSSNSTALYNFTAGDLLTKEAFALSTGGSGSSIFQVNGYDAESSIQIGGTSDDYNGAWLQGAGTTLSLGIDGGTSQGTTLINIGTGTNGTHSGQAEFASGSFLDLGFNSGAQSGSWTVLTAAGGIVDSGLSLAPSVDESVWSFSVVDGIGGSQSLVVTAIPEPSSIALMVIIGGAMLMTRRRRKA